jgi:hypothetical protein
MARRRVISGAAYDHKGHHMFKKISGLALLVLLAACGSNPTVPDTAAPAAPATQPAAQAAPAAASQVAPAANPDVVVNSTKYSTIAVVVTAAPGSDVNADDLDNVRKDLTDEVMSNLKVQSNLRAAPEGSKPNLVISVQMKELHYVSVTKRVMLGLFAGHATMTVDMNLQDQKTGTGLWAQSVDTTSSIWGGMYGSSTVSQVNGLADTITNAVKSKI